MQKNKTKRNKLGQHMTFQKFYQCSLWNILNISWEDRRTSMCWLKQKQQAVKPSTTKSDETGCSDENQMIAEGSTSFSDTLY